MTPEFERLRTLAQATVIADRDSMPEHAIDMYATEADEEFIGEATPRTILRLFEHLTATESKLARIKKALHEPGYTAWELIDAVDDILNEGEAA